MPHSSPTTGGGRLAIRFSRLAVDVDLLIAEVLTATLTADELLLFSPARRHLDLALDVFAQHVHEAENGEHVGPLIPLTRAAAAETTR